jgi:DNA invertase Pin-like site-specific DNA recombinase
MNKKRKQNRGKHFPSFLINKPFIEFLCNCNSNKKIIEHLLAFGEKRNTIRSALFFLLFFMSEIEYVVYCRKSTDENSGKQTQSIPDQIKRCIEYANNNGFTIKQKPSNFSDFETERELFEENTDKELQNRQIYQETRHLFIVKEQQSGKAPYIRPKRRKLIKMIEKGEIKGLLSYSPDRQARNIVEGGELIDLVDKEMIDLKYTNFHFEPDAS